MGMSVTEKVIKGLHDARRYLEDKEWHDRGASPHIDSINDALTLLKQEPVKPITAGDEMECTWYYVCPACRIAIDYHDKFCRHCGRELVW